MNKKENHPNAEQKERPYRLIYLTKDNASNRIPYPIEFDYSSNLNPLGNIINDLSDVEINAICVCSLILLTYKEHDN